MLNLVERVVGRRMLWKVARRLYLHARREGSLDFETNGEKRLQEALVNRSVSTGEPMRIYDVGANHGQWSRSLLTQLAAVRAPRARLTLFEPMPAILPSLQRLETEFAEFADIEIVPKAVSDEPGTATMVFTGVSAGTHHLDSADHRFEGEKIDVEVTTLDAVNAAAGGESVAMVKIDAEGFDPKVVMGMEQMLADGKVDVVQVEYSILFIRSRCYLSDLFQIAGRHGYSVALLTNNGFEIHPEWHPDLEHFYASAVVLLHERARSLMPARVVRYGIDNVHD